jgi:hypothetical protein
LRPSSSPRPFFDPSHLHGLELHGLELHDLELYGRNYSIFTSSHLCYGQAEAVRRYFVDLVYERFVQNGTVVATEMQAPCQPKGPKGFYIVAAKDLFYSPCTKYRDAAFQTAVEKVAANTTFRFFGQSDTGACVAQVDKAFDFGLCRSKYQE